MLRRFCMGQQLRALMSSDFMPTEMKRILLDFDHTFQGTTSGTLFNDILAFDGPQDEAEQDVDWKDSDLRPLFEDDHRLLQEWLSVHASDYDVSKGARPYAYPRRSVSWHGEVFAVQSTSPPNSSIIFRTNDEFAAGVIQRIFSHTRTTTDKVKITQTFFIIGKYAGLTGECPFANAYDAFPDAGVRCVSTSIIPNAILLSRSDIVCHFASVVLHQSEVGCDVLYIQALGKVKCCIRS